VQHHFWVFLFLLLCQARSEKTETVRPDTGRNFLGEGTGNLGTKGSRMFNTSLPPLFFPIPTSE
jgi:hypothetical protein